MMQALFLASLFLHPANRAEWNPPERFDHPFDGRLIEWRLPREQVAKECARLARLYFRLERTPNYQQRGCSFGLSPRLCHIVYIDKPFGLSLPAAVRRHEIGHCNGWPADHSR